MEPHLLQAGPADSRDATDTVEDSLADMKHDPASDYEHQANIDVPMDDCSETANAASNTESADMADCNMVPHHYCCYYSYTPVVLLFCIAVISLSSGVKCLLCRNLCAVNSGTHSVCAGFDAYISLKCKLLILFGHSFP